jgi:glutamate formiminotransferase
MRKIISVVPNICEGRDQKFVDYLVQKLHAVDGLILLDVSRDTSRNRTVFSFTGSQESIFQGGFVLYEEAIKHIDMRRHEGAYPRIGAVDVFPFVPLKDVTIEEAVAMSTEFAKQVAERFKVPVYLFAESAQVPSRRDIESIREGEYEGLEQKLKVPRWRPDFGPIEFKPDFGATIIGARYPLISFKVLLSTADKEVAQIISRAVEDIRHLHSYPGVEPASKLMQLTVSISNYRKTPMYRVIEAIKMEGQRYGVAITNVEMIGLIPEVAFIESALYYMSIHQFPTERLLERSIQKHVTELQLEDRLS